MHLARRIAALILLALWLPAVMHCRLEAAGVALGTDCCATAKAGTMTDECGGGDACATIEGGFTKPVSHGANLAPLLATLCTRVVCFCLPEPDSDTGPALASAAAARPRDWVPTWHFARRMAAPAHAPDSLLA